MTPASHPQDTANHHSTDPLSLSWHTYGSAGEKTDTAVKFYPGLISISSRESDKTTKRAVTKLFTSFEKDTKADLKNAACRIHEKWNSKRHSQLVSIPGEGRVDLFFNYESRPSGISASISFEEYQDGVWKQLVEDLESLKVDLSQFSMSEDLNPNWDESEGAESIEVTELTSGKKLRAPDQHFQGM